MSILVIFIIIGTDIVDGNIDALNYIKYLSNLVENSKKNNPNCIFLIQFPFDDNFNVKPTGTNKRKANDSLDDEELLKRDLAKFRGVAGDAEVQHFIGKSKNNHSMT